MNTLVIMAKHPVAGTVKTRLAKSLGEPTAARLADAFLQDLLAGLHGRADRHVLATWPADQAATTYFERISAGRFELWPQPPGTLGDRLAEVTAEHLGLSGSERVVVIGSDAPTLPIETVDAAFVALEVTDVVVAPAADGGYVLIGQRREVPGLYEGIDWSTPRVWEQTHEQLLAGGASFVELPGWYDIDTLDDLRRLARELRHTDRQGGAGQATRQRLETLPRGWDTRSNGR